MDDANANEQAPGAEEDGARIELRMNDAAGVEEATGAVAHSVGAAAGLDSGRLTRLRTVAEELVREARARPRAGSGDDIVATVGSGDGRVEVEVADLGLPVSPKESRKAASRRLAALGFVDELQIGTRGKAGNVARCAVRLGPVETGLAEERIAADADVVSDAEAEALEIREMKPADARELVRCVYRCYGYSYKGTTLYEPRAIVEALRSATMRSVVAVAPDGSVVGHAAVFVERAGDAVPEAGRMIVDPRYRGHRIATRLAKLRFESTKDSGLLGFWAEAVTNHTSSQREVLGNGGVEVGLLIAASPPTAMVGFESPSGARWTLLAMYTPLKRLPDTIHLPERHAALVAELAGRLGAEREIVTYAEPGPPGPTSIWTSVDAESGLAHLRVDEVGDDLASRVADALDGLAAFDLGVVQISLPLSDPTSATAIDSLEALGFSFAAWMPRFSDGGDVLRMQRVGGHPVETEQIACARPEGEEVRDYVIADWHRVRRAGVG